MQQYLNLLKEIKEKGTYKPAAREGMPGTQSLFGYQFRHNLQEGFPLLTTKKMFWKGVVVELLWFLKGDTNIKYLVDNGVNIWNEDAYNYYRKITKANNSEVNPILLRNTDGTFRMLKFDEFIGWVKQTPKHELPYYRGYQLGDCGFQYGKVWRNWGGDLPFGEATSSLDRGIDQIENLINQLRKSPESRRHIITAIDPAHETDLALYWCHAMFQFNCRPLTYQQRLDYYKNRPLNEGYMPSDTEIKSFQDKNGGIEEEMKYMDFALVPRYYLDCQLYQRSADVFLGVPFNIASYALLTEILAKICNMVPGEFIHTFGDVHIYDNHREAVEEQLQRIPTKLPKLIIEDSFLTDLGDNFTFEKIELVNFDIADYNPQPSIKAELSTGLKK